MLTEEQKKYAREYYHKNLNAARSYGRAKAKRYRDSGLRKNYEQMYYKTKTAARISAFKNWKSSLSCSACGESHPSCLEFHHKNPSQKEFSIADKYTSKTLDELKKEAEKCIVLCANCHRKMHDSLRYTTWGNVKQEQLAVNTGGQKPTQRLLDF